MADQISELRALAGVSELAETVTVTSRQVDKETNRAVENKITHVIEPFTYRKLFKVLGHVNAIFAAVSAMSIDLSNDLGIAKLIMAATAVAGDDVQAVICLAIDRPVEYLDTIMPDEGISLTAAVIRVNKDFFIQRILPLIATLRTEVLPLTAAVGETS